MKSQINKYDYDYIKDDHNYDQKNNKKFDNEDSDTGLFCYFHSKSKITNFCLTCNMPLCPECLKNHTQKHVTNNEDINYDTIQNVIEETQDKFKNAQKSMSENKQKLKFFEGACMNQESEIEQHIEYIRDILHKQVDIFLKNEKKEILIYQKQKEQNDLEKIANLENGFIKLDSILHRYNMNFKNDENKLKMISQILKDDFIKNVNQYSNDIEKFKNQFQKEKINIQFQDVYLSQLQNIMKQSFVTNIPQRQIQNNPQQQRMQVQIPQQQNNQYINANMVSPLRTVNNKFNHSIEKNIQNQQRFTDNKFTLKDLTVLIVVKLIFLNIESLQLDQNFYNQNNLQPKTYISNNIMARNYK